MPHLEQTNVLTALSEEAEIDAFLGNVVDIAIVTRDRKCTMDGLLKLRIGRGGTSSVRKALKSRLIKANRPSLF